MGESICNSEKDLELEEDYVFAVYKAPGCAPELLLIKNDATELEALIGGQINTLRQSPDAGVLYLPDADEPNCRFLGRNWLGSILVIGLSGKPDAPYCSLPDRYTEEVMCGLENMRAWSSDPK